MLSEDADIDDNIIGFHAQQAVEKAMKVVLADADLPLTHDLKFYCGSCARSAPSLPTTSRKPRG